MITTSGVVPWGNPDRFKTYRNTHWQKYNVAELKELEPGKWEAVHGGYNVAYMNKNPHYGVPLDALRTLAAPRADVAPMSDVEPSPPQTTTVVSPTQLTATVPTGLSGMVNVLVQAAGRSSSALSFTVAAASLREVVHRVPVAAAGAVAVAAAPPKKSSMKAASAIATAIMKPMICSGMTNNPNSKAPPMIVPAAIAARDKARP